MPAHRNTRSIQNPAIVLDVRVSNELSLLEAPPCTLTAPADAARHVSDSGDVTTETSRRGASRVSVAPYTSVLAAEYLDHSSRRYQCGGMVGPKVTGVPSDHEGT
jgi:hypothetical protein